jgi:hypothetical protein
MINQNMRSNPQPKNRGMIPAKVVNWVDLYIVYEPDYGPDEVFAGYELLHPSRDYVIITEGNNLDLIGDDTF